MVGLSAPRMLTEKITVDERNFTLYDRHYYLMGSYAFFLSEDLRLKPAAVVRYTQHAPVSVDVMGILNIHERYNAGVFTRNLKSYGALVQMIFKNCRLGYVIELPGSASSSLRYTSHEFTLGMSMGILALHDKTTHTF
jgi:hypothetical protein